jgi:butyrate kinase
VNDLIYRNYAIRYIKRSGTFAVLEPHSDILIKCGGFAHTEDAAKYIDYEIARIAAANEDEGEYD